MRIAPDAILVQTELSGVVSSIQDDPDSPDGNWLTASTNGETVCRVSFPSPDGNLTGQQEFRALIRKNATGGNSVGWSLELYENGTQVSVLNTGSTSSTAGEVVAGTWDASAVSNDADVEARLFQSSGGTGNPNNRRYMEVGAIEWNSTEEAPSDDLTATGVVTGSPDLGSPTIGQTHALTGTGVASGAFSLGSPSIGQTHDLTASALTSGGFSLGSPDLSETAVLTADGVTAGAVSVGSPSIGQTHALVGSGVTLGWSIDSPDVGQVHALGADGLTASWDVGSPTLSEATGQDDLTADGLLTGAVSVGSPSIGQTHDLSGSGITLGWSIGAPSKISGVTARMSRQGARQSKFRSYCGVTKGAYNENLIQAAKKLTSGTGTVNELEIQMLQNLLGSSNPNINGLRAEYAKSKGLKSWNGLGGEIEFP